MWGLGFDPWVGKIPWRWERLPTPVFWPREFHGLYRPCGHKESDTTEFHFISLRKKTRKILPCDPGKPQESCLLPMSKSKEEDGHPEKIKTQTYSYLVV